jgi:hypothetical protein
MLRAAGPIIYARNYVEGDYSEDEAEWDEDDEAEWDEVPNFPILYAFTLHEYDPISEDEMELAEAILNVQRMLCRDTGTWPG